MLRIMSQDRPELHGGLRKQFTIVDASKEDVVVVDPYSTGCLVVQEIQSRGYRVITLWLWTKGFSHPLRELQRRPEVLQRHAGVGRHEQLPLLLRQPQLGSRSFVASRWTPQEDADPAGGEARG